MVEENNSWPASMDEPAATECVVELNPLDGAAEKEYSLKEVQLSINRSNSSFMPKPKEPMQLEFKDVCCYVPAQFEVPGMLNSITKAAKACANKIKGVEVQKKERQILFSVTGVVNPGEVVAIMGPSGSGKTTLISLFAGRNKARHTGDILYNKTHKPTEKAFKRRLGYVSQEDVMFEGLTVTETLYYTAVLRLPRAMTKKEKLERVKIICECLGITRVKDSIIGGFRIGRRGISGGEKKRVAIGQELLYNPSVILLDEPTSGLDSTTALNLIHTLQTLAQVGNRTIVTTIHQPSSRIYQMLDKLLLMGQGHMLFYGDASAATDYFKTVGYAMPYGMNPADYFLDIASGWSGELKDCGNTTASDPELKVLLKAIERQPYSRENSGNYKEFHASALETSVNGSGKEVFGMKWANSRTRSKVGSKEEEALEGPTFFTQAYVIGIRSFKDRRFERFSGDSLFTIFFMAFLVGILWWQSGVHASISTFLGVMDVTAVLFFMVTFLSFNILFSSIFTFPNEKTLLIKEREAGTYPISSFFVGRTLSDLPLDTLLPVVVSTIIYCMVGLKPTVDAYLLTEVVVLLTCYTAGSLGLLIGAWFMNLKRAQSAATVLMLTIMLTGGFFVRDIPVWISWIQYLSYILYAFYGLVDIHLTGRTPDFCSGADADSTMCSGMMGAGGATSNLGVGAYIGILALMLVVLRFGVYVALRFGAKSK